MKEIRIYFECLEQASHFIAPIIENTHEFKAGKIVYKLIKLIGAHIVYSKKIAPVVHLKDPDILFTVIHEGIEYPLFQLEISTAVFTEDHELQRFDGLISSISNNCLYGKLSPISKKSQHKFGGNIEFDYRIPYAAILKKYKKVAYHFDWPCDNDGNVIVNSDFLSCPQQVESLEFFIKKLIESSIEYDFTLGKWEDYFTSKILESEAFKNWSNVISQVELPNVKKLKTTRTKWIEDEKRLHLKINRFGHAMDPERGMLAFYGTISDNVVAKMLFDEENKSWYKDTPKEYEIEEYLESTSLINGYDYLYCFMLGSSLYKNGDFYQIVRPYSKSESKHITLNLTKFLEDNFNKLNKPLRTIFKFANELIIVDKNNEIRIKFEWAKVNAIFDYSKFPEITPIGTRRLFDEDDITYISVHNILKPNNYKVISVSYPGAQGDRVVLADVGMGRKQNRRYVDIISYLPKSHAALQENKGKFSKQSLQTGINELTKYKSDLKYTNAFKVLINTFDKECPETIKIGIGFWANIKFKVEHVQSLNIDSLDYFIYISNDMKLWKVFNTGDKQIFIKTSGTVDIPIAYQISTIQDDEQVDMFDFLV